MPLFTRLEATPWIGPAMVVELVLSIVRMAVSRAIVLVKSESSEPSVKFLKTLRMELLVNDTVAVELGVED